MITNKIQPRKALNKAFLKVKPNRDDIAKFQDNLMRLFEDINESESEEFHKNLVSDFFKKTYYSPHHFINTKGRNDLVIHNGKDAKSSVGVILEAKKPTNNAEILKVDNLNTKALQELVLYFLRDRVSGKNLELKHLIVTNVYEWFIFDAVTFDKLFAQNQELVKKFIDFEEGRLTGKTTDFFYQEIAQRAIAAIADEIPFTYFDIRDYQQYLKRGENEHQLIALFKLFSPEHLLKLPFANDSNSLDKTFYSELLHIIGLTETKEGGKKLIGRKTQRDRGSLLENAMEQLDSLDKISRLEKPEQFGETYQDRLFNVGLELAITWVNRILFLKLLEAQLIKYHKGENSYTFLSLEKVKNYDDLNSLFFSVLARKTTERDEHLNKIFANVPYLNSSLFELTDIEHSTIVISNLRDEKLPIFTSTVLKDHKGNTRSGELNALQYLFEFLNAYDFSSEGSEEIQEDNKRLINASVLGLIFEKINGYKDGSYFTPGFITMYMCRETIRRAVVQKFNEIKGWNCQDINDLYDKIKDKKEANQIINSLKICDPAVGSGHFLVSALNEMIAIKSELKILIDKKGKTLRDYQVEVANDELVVTDDDGLLFEYNPKSPESQRIQETLFHEKQTIIENCLFGVDINPNSVKICRLRLWIEVLKNAYYKAESHYTELETLPNIDINIKCGNSLISRFALDADLRQSLRKGKCDIDTYKSAVQTYRNAESKEQTREMESIISSIKGNFRTTLQGIDPKKTKLRGLEGELYNLQNQILLFEETTTEKKARSKKITKLSNEIDKLKVEIEEIESGKIYENALEWRFEFPEVLNNDGDFLGFDVVIGNPPWGANLSETEKSILSDKFSAVVASKTKDTYLYFFMVSENIAKPKAFISIIVPNTWTLINNAQEFRQYLLRKKVWEIIDYGDGVFEDATVESSTLMLQLIDDDRDDTEINTTKYIRGKIAKINLVPKRIWQQEKLCRIIMGVDTKIIDLINKLESQGVLFEERCEIIWGIKPYQTGYGFPKQTKEMIENRVYHSPISIDETWKPLLVGTNINSYSINKENIQYIKYGKNLMYPSNQIKMENPKILIRQTSDKIRGYYDDEKFYCQNSLFIITSDSIDLKYLLALLNSQLINFYYGIKNPQKGKVFAEIKPSVIKEIPIVLDINQSDFRYIKLLVDQILTAKKSDKNADTIALEKEIDKMVYQLYELTEEEITIVEGETS
jgi:adenine-specific DNA-methyltransferase